MRPVHVVTVQPAGDLHDNGSVAGDATHLPQRRHPVVKNINAAWHATTSNSPPKGPTKMTVQAPRWLVQEIGRWGRLNPYLNG